MKKIKARIVPVVHLFSSKKKSDFWGKSISIIYGEVTATLIERNISTNINQLVIVGFGVIT